MRSGFARGAGILLTAACGLPLSAAPARKAATPPAGPSPATLVAALEKAESSLKSGRVSVSVVRRRGKAAKNAAPAALREAGTKGAVHSQRREYLVWSGADWRQDITVMDSTGNPTMQFNMGVQGKTGRVLQATGTSDMAERRATVGIDPRQTLTTEFFTGKSAAWLRGIRWTGAKKTGDRVTLTGAQGDARCTVVLRTTPRVAIESLVRTEKVVTPIAEVNTYHEFKASYAVENGTLVPKSVDQIQYPAEELDEVVLTRYTVEGARLNDPVGAQDLTIALPAGTRVVDNRFDPPLRYVRGESELTQAELKALHERQTSTVAKVGRPAPEWEVKTLEGKTAKLSDYRGKVVLLTWFASW